MTTRSKEKATKQEPNKIAATRKHGDNRIFLLDGKFVFNDSIVYIIHINWSLFLFVLATLVEESSADIEIISLRNPATEKTSKYLYAKEKKQFFEILSFSEEPRSWFANELVYPNGNIFMTSPFDPLFWALYYIRLNNVDKCQPIEQTLMDYDFPNAYMIADVLTVEQLAMVSYWIQSFFRTQ